jgi:opacity protein-like surface antigen
MTGERAHRNPDYFKLCLAILGASLMVASSSNAEVYSDIYLGASITGDSTYVVDGSALPPSITCLRECGSTISPLGGLRVGYYTKRFPWLGVAGDFSAFIAGWGLESPYEVSAFPVSALLTLRAPLVKREGYDYGRVQPYIAVGPSLVVSMAELATGWPFLGTGRVHSDISADIGFDGRAGLRILASDWISVILEYRLSYFSPSWTIEGREVETSFWTNHFSLGFGLHY